MELLFVVTGLGAWLSLGTIVWLLDSQSGPRMFPLMMWWLVWPLFGPIIVLVVYGPKVNGWLEKVLTPVESEEE